MFDFTILTDHRYVNPSERNDYINNVLLEDGLLKESLEKLGFQVHRTNWDDPGMNWSETRFVIFRTTWDYFERFNEFEIWLDKVSKKTRLINSKELIYWNIDKHYLKEIESKGVRIPPTEIIIRGDHRSLHEHFRNHDWDEIILKPTISGAARHTYRFTRDYISDEINSAFQDLITQEDMMIQEYQHQITSKGEVAFVLFGGVFSHAVLKMAKPGDFRVQDDFGGTLHEYIPTPKEIEFVQNAIKACPELPIYARIDVLWDNNDELAVGEIELIEPELWFRRSKTAANDLANIINRHQAKS